MITIYKYRVQLEEIFTVALPAGAEFLSVQVQNGNPEMWFRVDTSRDELPQLFGICGTGAELPAKLRSAPFKGTFQLNGGDYVFHLFGGIYV